MADNTKLGYIIPTDCPLLKKDPMGFATHAISMKDIESVSLRIRAKHVLMLFDSCFSGSLFALVRAAPEDVTEKSSLPVRQYITAGREDEQVPDKSMFKRCLLLGLDGDADLTGDGYITGSELGMYLSDKVVNYTHRQQHPQYGKINNPDLDRGDFIFVPKVAKEQALSSSIDEERRRLAEERERLRQEWERLEAEKRLLKEGRLLESEPCRPEKKKQKLAVTIPQPKEHGRLRIGVLTKLEKGYFAHLKEVLGKREDCQLLELRGPIDYEKVELKTARSLKQKFEIDMLICVKKVWTNVATTAHTKIIDISGQRLVQLKSVDIGVYDQRAYGWEKKLVKQQIGSIEEMIDRIYREKRKSKQKKVKKSS